MKIFIKFYRLKISEKFSESPCNLETNSVCWNHGDEMCCACCYTINFI